MATTGTSERHRSGHRHGRSLRRRLARRYAFPTAVAVIATAAGFVVGRLS